MSDHATTDGHGHAADTGHDSGHDEHHDGGTLGPIDWPMWGMGVLGVAAALVVVACAVIATNFVFITG